MATNQNPGDIELTLEKKAINFIVLALDRQLAHLDAQLASGRLTEDDEAEVGNDRDYLRGLRAKFAELAQRR